MSIVSMVDTHIAAAKGSDINVESPPAPVGVATNVVNQLTRWIPTETIALYVALLPLLGTVAAVNPNYKTHWILFYAILVADPIIVVLIALSKAPETEGKFGIPNWTGFKWPVFAIVTSMIAFSAWAFALPGTPLGDVNGYNTTWNAAIIIGITTVIPLVANALHKTPNFDQVQTVAQGAKNA
jgi:hypothetical protein